MQSFPDQRRPGALPAGEGVSLPGSGPDSVQAAMKRFLALAGMFLLLVVSVPVLAQPGEGQRRFERFEQQRAWRQEALQRQREQRREEFQHRREEGRVRLTPEEREQLRRDIREHGRELYRERPRRF